MTVQNIVNLAGSNGVAYRLVVCSLGFADFHKFPLLGSCLKGASISASSSKLILR